MKNMKFIKKTVIFVLTAAILTTIALSGALVGAAVSTESLKALKFEIQWADNVTASDMVVARFGLSTTQAWPLNVIYNAEKLSYEVYIPSDGNYVYGMGGFDGQSPNLPANWFPASQVDQNARATFTQLDELGTDKWIKRDVEFTTDTTFWHLGPSVITSGYDMTTYSGKTSTVYYRNIKILSAGGNRDIYNGTQAITSYLVENNATYANKIKSITITDGTYTFNTAVLPTSTPTPTTVPGVTVTPTATPTAIATPTQASTLMVPPTEKCLSYKIIWKNPMTQPAAPMFDWRNINGAGAFAPSFVLNEGDKLIYDVYIPTNGNYVAGMGGLDYQTANTWSTFRFFDGEQFDENGISLFSDLETEYGLDKWITREFTLSANLADGNGFQHIGPATLVGEGDYMKLLGLAGKTSVVYYKNIKVKHVDGSVSVIFNDSNELTSTEVVETHLQNFASVTLSMINDTAPTDESEGGSAQTSDRSSNLNTLLLLISVIAFSAIIYKKRIQVN